MHSTVYSSELLVVLLAATGIALLFERFRLPALLGFIFAGSAIGPHGLGLLTNLESIHGLAEIGMIFLMLTIGLEFSFNRLKGLEKIALIGGTLQILLSILLSIAAAVALHWTVYQGFVLGSVIAMSSTAVVFRNLMDRGQLDTMHGRISVAFLVFQDLAVGPLLIFMGAFGKASDSVWLPLAASFGKAALLLFAVFIISKYVLPTTMRWIALSRSREIFLLSTVLLCFGSSWASAQLGLSAALGAFFAGIMLANTDYHYQVAGEITPFRHIFVSIFFISIGLLFDPVFAFLHASIIVPVLLLILVVNSVVVTLITLGFGYPPRVAITTGIILSQIGEFSFLLLETAKKSALIDHMFYQTILSASALSIFLTPFLFSLIPILMRFSSKIPSFGMPPTTGSNADHHRRMKDHIVICGYGTAGQDLAASLALEKMPFLVIEMNPKNIETARKHEVPVLYGDAMNENVLKEVSLKKAKAIVVSFGDASSIAQIVRMIQRLNPDLLIVVRARYERDIAWLYDAGANVVIMEELEVSAELTRVILNHFGHEKETIKKHIERIRARKEFLVEKNIFKKIRK